MGYGSRYDFTTANIKDKGEFSHDYDRMGSVKNSIELSKRNGSRKADTFGVPYNDKQVVHGIKSHYFGKGSLNYNGIGPVELDLAVRHL
jgi:hypothetical protein